MKNKKPIKKLYVIRKYIWASNPKIALAKERNIMPDDIWIDEDWKKNSSNPKDAIGFYVENSTEEYYED